MNKTAEAVKKVSKRKEFTGVVLSTKTAKTVIVGVTSTHRHPIYRKAVKKLRHFAVHNPEMELAVGDHVTIGEIRPVSKTKHFIILTKLR